MAQYVAASELRRADEVEWFDGERWRVRDVAEAPDRRTVWLVLASPAGEDVAELRPEFELLRLDPKGPLTYPPS